MAHEQNVHMLNGHFANTRTQSVARSCDGVESQAGVAWHGMLAYMAAAVASAPAVIGGNVSNTEPSPILAECVEGPPLGASRWRGENRTVRAR
jgi:hypothetical protein